MKRKFLVGAIAIIVVIAIVALMIFVFSGKDKESSFDLNGVWKVANNVTDGSISIPQSEYIIFSEDEASGYRDGNAEPYIESSYNISGDVLELPDISRTYHIAQQTEQYISLYTTDKTYMVLVKADSEETLKNDFDSTSVSGKWSVTYRPTEEPIVNEYLVFENGMLADYRDNSEKPSIEAKYEWNDNIITVPDLEIEMMGSRVADSRIILVDVHDGYVWLLTETEN